MTLFYSSASYEKVLNDYFNSYVDTDTTFPDWVESNYHLYRNGTLGLDEKHSSEVDIPEYEFQGLSSSSNEWNAFKTDMTSSSPKYPDSKYILGDEVDNARTKYLLSNSARRKDFGEYFKTSYGLKSSPSGFKLFTKKTELQKQNEKEFKALKGKSDAVTTDVKSRETHNRDISNLAVKQQQKILDEEKKTNKVVAQNNERLKKIQSQIEDERKKRGELVRNTAPASFGKKNQGVNQKIFEWNNNDAYLIYSALFQPFILQLEGVARVQKFVKHVLKDNNYVKTRLDSVKNKEEPITEIGIIKLLAIFKAFPDYWKTGNRKTPKTEYIGHKEWKEAGTFTMEDCYDACVAIRTICRGKTYDDLTRPNVTEVKEGKLTTLKKKLIEDKVTFQWDDDLVRALKDKLLSPNAQISVQLQNNLSLLVKRLCKNEKVNIVRTMINKLVSEEHNNFVTDQGVVSLISMCVHHPPIHGNNVIRAIYKEESAGQEASVQIMNFDEVDKMCDAELIRTLSVYKRIMAMVNKGKFPFDNKMASLFEVSSQRALFLMEPSGVSKLESQEQEGEIKEVNEPTENELIHDYQVAQLGFIQTTAELTREATKHQQTQTLATNVDKLRRKMDVNTGQLSEILDTEAETLGITEELLGNYVNYLNALANQEKFL